MTSSKGNSSGLKTERPKPLLESFATLFYICKIFAIVPQDLEEFRRYKNLKKSPTGEGLVIIGMIILFINFNLMILVFETKTYLSEKNLLPITIGFVLTYYGLFLFMGDRITVLIKQQEFERIFLDLEEIDEDLRDLKIVINNNYIKYRLLVGIFLSVLLEISIFTVTFIVYVERINWMAWLWIYTSLPILCNTLDKLWYIGVLLAIRKRFEAINEAFDEEAFQLEKQRLEKKKLISEKKFKKETKVKIYAFRNQIRPVKQNFQVFGDVVRNSPTFDDVPLTLPQRSPTSSDSSTSFASTFATLETKFVKLCQLHDSLCNVGKELNKVYAFPILILMGYGFCIVTAQLYFFYCAHVDQSIPSLFRPAQSWWLTLVNIFYIASKCVFILHGNWQTNLESKKTGICIHRCALASDKNDIYEMVNHLSLKLFNHPFDFNACGYFPLNMATLFSFCGGITTYLIILIQFNLEEQQVKWNSENGKPMALIPNETHDIFRLDSVVNGTRTENVTSLFEIFYQSWNEYFNNV